MPKVNPLTKPPFLKMAPGMWFVVRLDGPMEEISIPKQKDPARVYPLSVFFSGPLPLPRPDDILGFVMRTPSPAVCPANFALAEQFDKTSPDEWSYYLLTYHGQKGSGRNRFNMWDVAALAFDDVERDTIEGKG